MISFVRGPVAAVGLSTAVIEVGGIGLEVQCTPDTLARLRVGVAATLHSSLVVREDSLTVFGFDDIEARDLFDLVQSVKGVGPRTAQAMLAVLHPDELRSAVANEDAKALTTVPGIGLKGAQRLILELKDRVGAPVGTTSPAPPRSGATGWESQVRDGLINLGWSNRDADRAVADVAAEVTEAESAPEIAQLLRRALQLLNRG